MEAEMPDGSKLAVKYVGSHFVWVYVYPVII